MKKMPEWFQGKLYSKGGVVSVDYLKKGDIHQKKIKMDRYALSMYHLIRGYQVIGKGSNINALRGIGWIRENYQYICEELFPVKEDKKSMLKMIESSTSNFRNGIYRIFGNK